MKMGSSWVPDVSPTSDFSLENLPFGIVTTPVNPSPHAAVAIGSNILDLEVLAAHPSTSLASLFPSLGGHEDVFAQPTLNAFAQLGRAVHREVRSGLRDLLAADTSRPDVLRDHAEWREKAILPQHSVRMHLPMAIGDYTDFYAGYHHAFAVGTMFRGAQNALQPNYTHLPVGYHGRASSIVVSGTPIRRPNGQILLDPAAELKQPITGPSRKLDFELELGCFIARPNEAGEAVGVDEADDRIFGYVLLNDWSARDIQAWEYVPLGPFNSKNFGTSVSPWVVLADALEPFRTKPIENVAELQGYLQEAKNASVFDIRLEVDLTSESAHKTQALAVADASQAPEGDTTTIARTSAKNLLWSFPQMIAHHTLGGCPLRTGDLLGSGTISGSGGSSECGSLLEMTQNGQNEVLLYGMDARTFLKDGDAITMRGVCGEDGARVGFGECRGALLPQRTCLSVSA
jgi:fumarylacetoacetase